MAEEYSRAQGNCDFCGQPCDDLDELNELTCSFSGCSVHSPYHQDCVEKYLRSIKLETNRKTGFRCPRGHGKGTKSDAPCPGKIEKSHPIHPRNLEKKKKRTIFAAQAAVVAPKPKPPAPKPVAKAPEPVAKLADVSADKKALAKAIASKNSPVPVVVDRRYDRAAPAQPTINELQAAKARALAELRGGGAALPAADAGPSTSTRPLHAVGLARLHTAVPETSAAAAATSNAWANPGKLQSVVAQQPKEPAFIPGYEPPSKPAKKAAAGGGITAAALAAAQPSGAAKKPPSELAESVAGDAASEADETKLTRAQKKALYRAEKAAAESEAAAAAAQQGGGGDARTATMSVTSDDQMSLASSDVQQHGGGGVSAHDVGAAESQLQLQPPRDYALEQACVQWLVANKVAQHVVQLQQLGFSDVLATVGVQRFGSDLVSAVCWLLEADLSQPLAALQEEAAGCTPEVDISAEMQQVLEIQGALEVPLELVQQAVVDGRGDLQAAVSLLVDSRTTSEDGTGTGNGDELAGTPPEWADVDVALLVEGMPSNLAALAAGEQLLRGRELLSALRAGEARQLEVAHAMAPQALPVASDAVLRPWSERHATTA